MFGPDGLLYTGDRRRRPGTTRPQRAEPARAARQAAADRPPPAQRLRDPAGQPVASTRGRAEIWALGLRNPFRFSFDRATGDLTIGDVGQDARRGGRLRRRAGGRGANYGWPCSRATPTARRTARSRAGTCDRCSRPSTAPPGSARSPAATWSGTRAFRRCWAATSTATTARRRCDRRGRRSRGPPTTAEVGLTWPACRASARTPRGACTWLAGGDGVAPGRAHARGAVRRPRCPGPADHRRSPPAGAARRRRDREGGVQRALHAQRVGHHPGRSKALSAS